MSKTMLKPKTAEPPVPDFAAAKARWTEVDTEFRNMIERQEAMRLAISFTSGQSTKQVPQHLFDKAKPFMRLGRRRREKLIDQLADLEDEIDDSRPKVQIERELWAAARRRETNRLAGELQPRHRAAVLAIAKAVEALSRAMTEETDIRAELARTAPEPSSAYLPNCIEELVIGTFVDWHSPASAWARRMRKLNILG